MRINHNIAALNTFRQLSSNNVMASKSLEKLSSGLRINRAGDDAAGLAISEKMRGQIRGLDQATSNAQDGISLIQTAEGALNEVHSILQRMNELAVQAANGTLSTNDRTAISSEITQLNGEIDRISSATKFNGQTLLAGTFGVQLNATSGLAVGSNGITAIDISGASESETYTIAVGAVGGAGFVQLTDTLGNRQEIAFADSTAGVLDFDKLGIKITVNNTWTCAGLAAANNGGGGAGTVITTASAAVKLQIGSENDVAQQLGISIQLVDSSAVSLNTASIDVSTSTDAASSITTIASAIDTVSSRRSALGAYQNRLEHTINNVSTAAENLTAAESRIRDVDMAKEMMEFTKMSILSQAATAMLAQANQQPQGVLQLLR